MKRLLILLVWANGLWGTTTHIDDLVVHDPCILADPHTNTYYIYRSFRPDRYGEPGKPAGIQVFTSKDLVSWDGPTTVFEIPDNFWADRNRSWVQFLAYKINKIHCPKHDLHLPCI